MRIYTMQALIGLGISDADVAWRFWGWCQRMRHIEDFPWR